jgi:hypothetical protein
MSQLSSNRNALNDEPPTQVGANLALVVGVTALGFGVYLAVTGHRGTDVTLPVLIGGSALRGWAGARKRS